MENFGDKLYQTIADARSLLFMQGEMAQLTYTSYQKFVQLIEEEKEDKISITYPVGYKADNTPINSTHNYTKEELISRYNYLALSKLPIDGLFQLVTIIESLLGDIVRNTLIEYPVKISNKRKVDTETVLSAKSLDEIKFAIVDSIQNELAYKSPKEYAEEFNKLVSVNLLEQPPYHKYIELKATRDIHIHNSGIANDIYTSKAATLARVKSGEHLPVDVQYFLQSYECCLQLTEILEQELNKIWPSPKYKAYKESIAPEEEKEDKVEQVIEEAKEEIEKKSM
ncbi:hypothetical protein [Aquimarina longa]|uniref:hypothetical protein n=1 Tax=Aquimarina longa TaxID=1080221 RepID=UPI000781699A|nr:hypothetical protein [Aquimarina longa]